jgi:hypothetical protein
VTPRAAYHRLNTLLWLGRLPDATIIFVDNATLPNARGITLHDGIDLFMKPVIVLNRTTLWGPTLVHEMLHIAEPQLSHGKIFETLVRRYWRIAKTEIKGLHKPRVIRTSQEEPHVG